MTREQAKRMDLADAAAARAEKATIERRQDIRRGRIIPAPRRRRMA